MNRALQWVSLLALVLSSCGKGSGSPEGRYPFDAGDLSRIGAPPSIGLNCLYEKNKAVLTGFGEWIDGNSDDFTYYWFRPKGDFLFSTQIPFGASRSGEYIAGIMVRQDLSVGSANLFAGYSLPGNGVPILSCRRVKGGSTYRMVLDENADSTSGNLSIARIGNRLVAKVVSLDGQRCMTWDAEAGDSVLCGIAVCGTPRNPGGQGHFYMPRVFENNSDIIAGAACPAELPPPGLSAKGNVESVKQKLSDPSMALWVAHRAETNFFPGNSTQARDYALSNEVDIIELDVRLTADSVPVVFHDDYLHRLSDGKGDLNKITLSELKKLRLINPDGTTSGFSIPTLEEYVTGMKGHCLFLLDKGWKIREQIVPVLERTGSMNQAIFLGTGSAKEASQFLNGFNTEEAPYYIHFFKNTYDSKKLDSLLRMDIIGFDLLWEKPSDPVFSRELWNRIILSDKRIMVNTFEEDFASGFWEGRSAEEKWMKLYERGAHLFHTDKSIRFKNWAGKFR